jgi:predicted regulator of Ras-like GTPase activity (Roadblock/LC7/MglB family)
MVQMALAGSGQRVVRYVEGNEKENDAPLVLFSRNEVGNMELSRLRLPVRLRPRSLLKVRETLRKHYCYVLDSAKEYLRGALNLERFDKGEINGEIYCSESGTLLYYLIPQERTFLEIGGLIDDNEGKILFQGFGETIRSTILSEEGIADLQWHMFQPTHENFALLQDEARHLEPTKQELSAVEAIKDENVRKLLRQIASTAHCLLEDLIPEEKKEETLQTVENLINFGLVNREFVVFCRSNNTQISRVANISAIQEASAKGLKCPFCERLFSDERIDQSLSCTAFGKKMIKPNFWLALLVLQLLTKSGVNSKNILVKEEKDSRVFDIIVNQEHHLIFIEIKDTPSNLDEIFLFQSRIDFYKPDMAVFLSTSPLRNEACLFFMRHKEVPTVIIEGLDEIEQKLRDTLQYKREDYFCDVFSKFESITEINIQKLFTEYFLDEKLQELQESVAEEEPPAVEEGPRPQPIAPAVEERAQQAALQEEIVEDDSYLIEEIIPTTNVHFVTVEEDAEKEEAERQAEINENLEDRLEEGADEKAVQEPQGLQEEDESVDELLEELDRKEEITLPAEEGEQGQLGLDADMSEGYILEEQFASEYGPDMVSSGEISEEERFIDESKDQLLKKIREDIESRGIAGRCEEIRELMKEFRTINSFDASLVSREGLTVIDLMEELDGERIAAVATEIHSHIAGAFSEVGFPEPQSIFINSKKDLTYIYPFKEVTMILKERLKEGEIEDDTSQLPGEMELRDIIMKKVLEDLSKTDGVIGNIVASNDGLSIDFIFNDDRDIDLLSSICTQILVDNEYFLSLIGMGEVKQLVTFTEDASYSMIPLNKEGVLISVMDPSVSKEIWKTKLSSSALMIASVFL